MSAPPIPTVDSRLYPFQPHYFSQPDGVRMHYLDEGAGAPVVMVHGNPTWSAYYRNLVLAVRGTHRCIVPDHIGCGLSDKPGADHYEYTLDRRILDLTALMDSLGIDEPISLVVHDWGGMIGMAWAVDRPERVKRLVVLNTSAFHLPPGKRFPAPLWLVRNTPLGALLVRGLNAFVRGANRFCVTRRPMPREIQRLYAAPYDSWAHRVAVLQFVEDIPLGPNDPSYARVSYVHGHIDRLADKPMLIGWGMKDFVFDHHFLKCWTERFPRADVHRFEDCGHYILEDAAEEIIPLVQNFLTDQPSAIP